MTQDQRQSVTPSILNQHIGSILDFDEQLSNVWVEGEITQLRHYKLGKTIYFNLSDGYAQIGCVLFLSAAQRLTFTPKEGLKVFAKGTVTFYKKKGQLSFSVHYMSSGGDGKLLDAFSALQQKLKNEGLFNPDLKKSIPKFPKVVGIITSPDSAAMIDFISILGKKAPHIRIVVLPCIMQGIHAIELIKKQLIMADNYDALDCIVIARGGGSNDDLSVFNDETIVRAIFSTKTPLISAIGHETDITLSDFVSDLRVATPTHAAHTLSQPSLDAKQRLADIHTYLIRLLQRKNHMYLDKTIQLLDSATTTILRTHTHMQTTLSHFKARLSIANPIHKLGQGYSLCSHSDTGISIHSINDVHVSDKISTRVIDGVIVSEVVSYEKKDIPNIRPN